MLFLENLKYIFFYWEMKKLGSLYVSSKEAWVFMSIVSYYLLLLLYLLLFG